MSSRVRLPAADMERFDKNIMPEPNSGCWLWTGTMSNWGYGTFSFKNKSLRAHVVAYVNYRGDYDNDLQLDHKCRVKSCVNPDHLEPVTGKENTKRAISAGGWDEMLSKRKGATSPSWKAFCKNGHPRTQENVGADRHCKICKKIKDSQRQARSGKNLLRLTPGEAP